MSKWTVVLADPAGTELEVEAFALTFENGLAVFYDQGVKWAVATESIAEIVRSDATFNAGNI